MYTDILFDADDTLLDFQKAQLISLKLVLAEYKMEFSTKLYSLYEDINHELWGRFEAGTVTKDFVQCERFSEFFRLLDISVDGYIANEVYQEALKMQSCLVPHAEEICRELSKEFSLSIVTNGVGSTQMQRITKSDIYPFIKNIVISEDIGVAKPDKRFFDYVLNLIKTDTKNVLLVGDSLNSDIQGANNADIDAVWYNPHMHPLKGNCHAKHIITDLRQLLLLL